MIEYIFRMSDDDGFMDRNEFIEYAKKSHAVKVIMKYQGQGLMPFPVWLQSRLISAGLEQVLGHTEKSYTVC